MNSILPQISIKNLTYSKKWFGVSQFVDVHLKRKKIVGQ